MKAYSKIRFEFENNKVSDFFYRFANKYNEEQKQIIPDYESVPEYQFTRFHSGLEDEVNTYLFTKIFSELYPREIKRFLEEDYLKYRLWEYNNTNLYSEYWDEEELIQAVGKKLSEHKEFYERHHYIKMPFSEILNAMQVNNKDVLKIAQEIFTELKDPMSKASKILKQEYNDFLEKAIGHFKSQKEDASFEQRREDWQNFIKNNLGLFEFVKKELDKHLEKYLEYNLMIESCSYKDVKSQNLGYDIQTTIDEQVSFKI